MLAILSLSRHGQNHSALRLGSTSCSARVSTFYSEMRTYSIATGGVALHKMPLSEWAQDLMAKLADPTEQLLVVQLKQHRVDRRRPSHRPPLVLDFVGEERVAELQQGVKEGAVRRPAEREREREGAVASVAAEVEAEVQEAVASDSGGPEAQVAPEVVRAHRVVGAPHGLRAAGLGEREQRPAVPVVREVLQQLPLQAARASPTRKTATDTHPHPHSHSIHYSLFFVLNYPTTHGPPGTYVRWSPLLSRLNCRRKTETNSLPSFLRYRHYRRERLPRL
ncbi:hypothetical protein FIBSPDRAFT_953052 [Athelia psychrophila]|uniref:Uncharacterized protein n=1 Tax=Athelia psychrophila TaxID=1759441 RepID=A0A166KSF8_9AGAM|nr:hypothetical protein FIBSPDRAFT_953052 [Fibularhizoctonia sp. CBS 109695]